MTKYLIAFLLIASIEYKAQEKNSFSLQESVEYAVKNSPNHQNAELDKKNSIYRKNEIAGIGLPQINGSVDLKDYIEIPTSLIPGEFFGAPAGTFLPVRFGTKYNATAGINASQLIFNSDYIFGLSAAKEYINLSKINVTRSKAELASQVSKAYYNVVINKERVKLLDVNVVRLKKILDDTKALNEQGFVEKIDVERLEVQYNNLITEREKINRLISLSESMLKFQMGYNLQKEITLTDTLQLEEKDESIINTSKIDISKRPDYMLLKSQQNLLDIDVKRLKWGYLPTLAAYGAYQFNAQRQEFDFLDTEKKWFKIALIGATLNLNIFDGFQRHYKIQQAKISSEKNLNTLKYVEQAAQLEATMAGISYENAFATLLNQKKNRELAQHIYEVAQKKYQQGIGSNIEILNAEATLKESETNYYNAVFDALVAKIDYLKATGNLVK
jgi:outer membrane protein TolC